MCSEALGLKTKKKKSDMFSFAASSSSQKREAHSKTDAILISGTLVDSNQSRQLYNISQAGSLSGDDLSENCEEVVLGIDPDRNGAIAILKSTRSKEGDGNTLQVRAQVIDVPVYKVTVGKTTKGRERIDATQLAALIKRLNFPPNKTVAFLEGGGVEYHFSSYSAFVQGLGVGIWEGVLSHAEIPWHKINSKTWKTLFGLVTSKKDRKSGEEERGGEGGEEEGKKKKRTPVKASSVALARKTFPDLDEHLSPKGKHGRADALLIASYGHLVRVQEEGLNSSLKETFLEAGIDGISSERLKLDLLTANELKILLKDRGLKVSGKKGDLIERLLQHSQKD